MNIVTSPNQYIVTISPKGDFRGETYGVITREAEVIAGKLLNDRSASHILYYYFALNQDNYRFALSCSEVCKRYNISEKQYRVAIKKLKEAGYLIPDENTKNGLRFLHIPVAYRNDKYPNDEEVDECIKINISQHKCKNLPPIQIDIS